MSGRSRKPQMELAKQFGFKDYAQPAGGCCFLTDEGYSNKLGDLWTARSKRDYELDDIVLLKVGRHIRPNPRFKMMIARDEGESRFLEGYRKAYVSLRAADRRGPLALIDGEANATDIKLAARVVARYSKQQSDGQSIVNVNYVDGTAESVSAVPFEPYEIPDAWHVGA